MSGVCGIGSDWDGHYGEISKSSNGGGYVLWATSYTAIDLGI